MANAKFSDDFKRDAVHQIVERGYPVSEVSKRLGVSTHSLYAWMKKFSWASGCDPSTEQSAEVRRLKLELARVTEERDILKKATAYFAKDEEFIEEVQRWIRDEETGEKTMVTKHYPVRKWWWQNEHGAWMISLRDGNKIVPLTDDNTS